jgi:hemolysin activation/secretion protein
MPVFEQVAVCQRDGKNPLRPTFRNCGLLAMAAAMAGQFIAGEALAQAAPDAGSILRQIEQQRPQPLPPKAPSPPTPPPPLQTLGQATVIVQSFRFAGNQLLNAQQLAPAVTAFVGRPLTFGELQNAAVAVANAYRAAGWVVRAYLPQQDITGGTVAIQIVEAVFGAVRQEGTARRVSAERIRRTVEQAQAAGAPLSATALDRALLLIDDLPGAAANGRLAEGQQEAQTDLVLTVSDGPLITGDLTVDNTGSRSTGPARLSLNASLNSPLQFADQAIANALHTEGSDYLRVGYSVPLGYGGLRASVNGSHLSYHLVTSEFANLDARGTSGSLGAELVYPVLRSRGANLSLTVGVDAKRFDNLSGGATATQYKTRQLSIGLNGNAFDDVLGGGASNGSLSFSQGKVDLSGSPNEAADAASTKTAGSFGKLRYAAARQQALNDVFSLFASLVGQVASKNLDSSEKFYLGGSTGVRAYPSNEGGGSEGHVITLELRARMVDTLNLSAFYDRGSIVINKNNDITGALVLNTYALSGAGVAVSWTAPFGLGLKATLARRIGSNPNPTGTGTDQDGSLNKTRVWVQASLPF